MLGIFYRSKEATSIGFSSKHKGFNWFLFILALVCGIGAYYASYKYLILALDMAEPNHLAREAAKILAVVTISTTALLFIVRPFIKNFWIKSLTILVISYEILTMATNQYVAFKDSAAPQVNNQNQIENIKAEISQLESDAISLRKNGEASGSSKYLVSRQQGNALLNQASEKTNEANIKRHELSELINNQKVAFATVIPDWILKIKCAVRSLILPGIISLCFYIIGSIFYILFGALRDNNPSPLSDGSDPKGRRKDNNESDNKSNNFKQIENSKNKSEVLGYVRQKYESIPNTQVLGKTNIPNTSEAKKDTASAQVLKIRKKRSKGTADTCITRGKNLRYKTLRLKVKNGLQPSIRSLRKAAGGGDYTTLSKYLSAMAQEGILEKQEDGTYKLVRKLKLVKEA